MLAKLVQGVVHLVAELDVTLLNRGIHEATKTFPAALPNALRNPAPRSVVMRVRCSILSSEVLSMAPSSSRLTFFETVAI